MRAPSIPLHFRLHLSPSWPCMHQTMVTLRNYHQISQEKHYETLVYSIITIQFPFRNPNRQRKIIMFYLKMPENCLHKGRSRYPPVVSWFRLDLDTINPKSSQPCHAASLFLVGIIWLLRQWALSISLFIGGGGGNSVLREGVRPCGGERCT